MFYLRDPGRIESWGTTAFRNRLRLRAGLRRVRSILTGRSSLLTTLARWSDPERYVVFADHETAAASDFPDAFDGPAVSTSPPRDVSALTTEPATLLDDPHRRRLMAQEGLRRASAFTWDRAASELHALLRELTGWGVSEWAREP